MGKHTNFSGLGLTTDVVGFDVKNYEEVTLPLTAKIEAPTPGAVLSGLVTIRGYATGSIVSGNLVVDGVARAPVAIGPRPMIAQLFQLPTAENLGFEVVLDTRQLSEGAHTVSVSLSASAFVIQRLINGLLQGLGQETNYRLAPPQTISLSVTRSGSGVTVPLPMPMTGHPLSPPPCRQRR